MRRTLVTITSERLKTRRLTKFQQKQCLVVHEERRNAESLLQKLESLPAAMMEQLIKDMQVKSIH